MEKFSSSLYGYNRKEVNAFVDQMTYEYESMLNKLKEQDEKLDKLNSSFYSTDERDLIIRNAKEKADSIIETAKKNASVIVNDALIEAEEIEKKASKLKDNIEQYKRQTKEIVKSQMDILNNIENSHD